MQVKQIIAKAKSVVESPQGKAQINKENKNHSSTNMKEATAKLADRFRTILIEEVNEYVNSGQDRDRFGGLRDTIDTLSGSAVTVNSAGEYQVNLSFSERSLKRPSLSPARYSGVENIVDLINKGYNIRGGDKKRVYGKWHAMRYGALLNRDPADFISKAINRFIRENEGNYNSLRVEANPSIYR